jgi:hypothetical protein
MFSVRWRTKRGELECWIEAIDVYAGGVGAAEHSEASSAKKSRASVRRWRRNWPLKREEPRRKPKWSWARR